MCNNLEIERQGGGHYELGTESETQRPKMK